MSPRGREDKDAKSPVNRSGKKRNEKTKEREKERKAEKTNPTGGGGGGQHLLHGRRFTPSCRGRRHSDPFLFSPLGHSREARAPKRYVQTSRLLNKFTNTRARTCFPGDFSESLPRDTNHVTFHGRHQTSSRITSLVPFDR